MNKLDKDYQKLLKDILKNGVEKEDRTGTGTLSVFGRQIRHNMKKGFPLLTTKKMAVKTMMTELKWFLKGDTNIKYLVDNGCNIWNGDAYKKYETYAMANSYGTDILSMKEFIEQIKTDDKFAAKWGELGPIYGAQWRHWLVKDESEYDGEYVWVDQRELSFEERYELYMGIGSKYTGNAYGKISTLDILDEADVPTRAISLMWNQRSVDTFLGLPFNIASYGMLLQLLSKEVNMVPDELVGNLGDVHLYSNHIKQAKEQIKREPYQLPVLTKLEGNVLDGEFDYTIEYYESWPKIEAPLSN